RLPLHAGASQKALLAFLAEEEVGRVATGSLERLCRATITDPEELRENLAEIRKRGWAISFEETNVGVWGVAVPLLEEYGGPVAVRRPSKAMPCGSTINTRRENPSSQPAT